MGDSGTINIGDTVEFRITVKKDPTTPLNLGGASLLQMIFMKPDNSKFVRAAILVTDGSDGKMKYKVSSSELDMKGWWKLQGYIELASDKLHTQIAEFEVFDNL
jgi:hypothetical protein